MSGAMAITQPALRRSVQIASVLVLALILTVTAQQILRMRGAVMAEREQHVVRLSMAFADQVTQAMSAADVVLRTGAEQWSNGAADAPAQALNESMRRRLAGVPQVLDLTLVDAAGRIVGDTRFGADGTLPEAGAALLHGFAANGADEVRLSNPFRTSDGRWTVLMARRIDQPGGAFKGIALAWLNMAAFEGFFRAADLSDDGAVLLHRNDGVALARFPHLEAAIGRNYADTPLFRETLARGPAGTLEMVSPLDGMPRLVAARELRGYPLAVQVSVGEGPVLAAWRSSAKIFGVAAAMAVVVVGALLLVLGQKASDLDRLVAGYRGAKDAAIAANAKLRDEMEERGRAEAALRHAQRIEVMGQLTGSVAHDFNNLLTVLLGNLDLLEMDPGLTKRAQERIAAMRGAAERGEMLTGQLLAFSRRQQLKPERVDLDAAVSGLSDLMQSAVGSRVRVEINPGQNLPAAMVDPHQLELMLFNLLINARDAMPEGGVLTITTVAARLGQPETADDPPAGDFVVLRVRDTGAGMTPAVLARALEPFFTTKGVGTGSGLGLSQVYGVARQSGGGVRIESAPGRGTTVSVYLPVAADHGARPAPAPTAVAAANGARVLLVDDDAAVRITTALILKDLGFVVLEAADSALALMLLESGAAVDVLVTDIAMPGMLGAELAQRVVALRPNLPVVFVSGHADPGILLRSGRGPRRLVRKPFRPAELAGEILAVLRPPV
jgi:signal transduction histidine kinase